MKNKKFATLNKSKLNDRAHLEKKRTVSAACLFHDVSHNRAHLTDAIAIN